MKNKKFILFFLVAIMSFFIVNPNVSASEFNFSVTPVITENQIDKQKTYFDLLLEPEQKETLTAKLRNDTDREVKVDVDINSATTNINGVVEYDKNNIKSAESLKYNLKDYVEVPKQISLAPKSESEIKIDVTMPKEKFDGIIAGGISFKEHKDEDKTSETSQGIAIKNEYSFVVALLLRQNKNSVEPNLVLHNVKADQVNARNVIFATVENDQKTYINQVTVDGEITKKGSKEMLYQENKEHMQFAPNSDFHFPISLKGDPLKAGNYHVKVVFYGNPTDKGSFTRKNSEGENEKFQYRWVLEKDFTIDGKVARSLNEKDVSIKKDYTWLYVLLGFLLLLFAIFVVWFIRRKNKKEEKDEE